MRRPTISIPYGRSTVDPSVTSQYAQELQRTTTVVLLSAAVAIRLERGVPDEFEHELRSTLQVGVWYSKAFTVVVVEIVTSSAPNVRRRMLKTIKFCRYI